MAMRESKGQCAGLTVIHGSIPAGSNESLEPVLTAEVFARGWAYVI